MPAWTSPFSIPEPLQKRLVAAGWSQWQGALEDLPAAGVVLYAAPDQLLAGSTLSLDAVIEGYSALLALQPWPRLILGARLELCTDAQLVAGAEELLEEVALPTPDPLAAAVCSALAERAPALIDAYLDLELRADLLGDEPDVAYRQRLRQAFQEGDLLQAWRSPSALQVELQVELDALQEESEQLKAGLTGVDIELAEAREEAELTLLQLHQVQEELEHYFLLSRGQKQLLADHQQLASGLLSALTTPAAARPPLQPVA